eukprot:CAMPEP_0169113986 /NCGR_PEP_ID=MMETSP1015-20121227/28502_1 /TAXON_ID=342587 /ORGANISM="Karlodinium micrum, Strain CCMP2283" /LENGTH=68 /DNA_ID=CAMNT_0009176209 /DNA_START=705 /DNA_END=911 /DNA_ORIENTATION=+
MSTNVPSRAAAACSPAHPTISTKSKTLRQYAARICDAKSGNTSRVGENLPRVISVSRVDSTRDKRRSD